MNGRGFERDLTKVYREGVTVPADEAADNEWQKKANTP